MSRFSDEERQELIKNLKFEVSHRAIQFRNELAHCLENFKLTQETLLSHIPKSVRIMTMRDFGRLYNGNVQAAVRGHQKAKFMSERGEQALEKIDKNTRKRKWVESQENDSEMTQSGSNSDLARATKTPRLMPASPNKGVGSSNGPGTIQRARLNGEKTPGKVRTLTRRPASPSPQKVRPPFNSTTTLNPRPFVRPPSPLKPKHTLSSTTFNPSLPKAPTYPRLPLKDDKNSNNVFSKPHNSVDDLARNATGQTLRRTKSTISVKRDPSYLGGHSRTNSQTSVFSNAHSRTNSDHNISPPSSQATQLDEPYTPKRPASSFTRSYSVTISTKDGHLLEFDPLMTSPGQLDALEGVSNSAKKQARQDMGRLMQAAVEKWKIA